VPFYWSGRNSVGARRAAGAALARRLLELRRDDPLRDIYVIAHSHGGSVLAYALKQEPELVDHVDGFIALATPWIGVQANAYALPLRSLLFRSVFYLSLLPSLLFAGRLAEWWVDYLITRRERDRGSLLTEDDFARGFGEFAIDMGT
jgi:alpha-beta hydrolase superfamily lysophospholipase